MCVPKTDDANKTGDLWGLVNFTRHKVNIQTFFGCCGDSLAIN